MYYQRETKEGIDPIWEYCKQRHSQRARRHRLVTFLSVYSVLGIICILAWVLKH